MDRKHVEYIAEREKVMNFFGKNKEALDRIIAKSSMSDDSDVKLAGMACSFVLADYYHKKSVERGEGWQPSFN